MRSSTEFQTQSGARWQCQIEDGSSCVSSRCQFFGTNAFIPKEFGAEPFRHHFEGRCRGLFLTKSSSLAAPHGHPPKLLCDSRVRSAASAHPGRDGNIPSATRMVLDIPDVRTLAAARSFTNILMRKVDVVGFVGGWTHDWTPSRFRAASRELERHVKGKRGPAHQHHHHHGHRWRLWVAADDLVFSAWTGDLEVVASIGVYPLRISTLPDSSLSTR